jgi:hypothetical protein
VQKEPFKCIFFPCETFSLTPHLCKNDARAKPQLLPRNKAYRPINEQEYACLDLRALQREKCFAQRFCCSK